MHVIFFLSKIIKTIKAWCQHSKEFEPEFNKAAAEIKDKKLNVGFGNVDATLEEELANKFEIQGFPTAILFLDQERIVY